jgi:hypothetical protein
MQQAAVDIDLTDIIDFMKNTTNVLKVFTQTGAAGNNVAAASMDHHESHLNVPFLVAAGIFMVACFVSMIVLACFPKLGREGLRGNH